MRLLLLVLPLFVVARPLVPRPLAQSAPQSVLLSFRGGATLSESSAWSSPERVQALHALVVSTTYYVGTMMSSLSGCISAGTKSMDILGCVVVSCMTAIGGGTLRDLILDRKPYWLTAPAHLHLSVWTSVVTFLIWPTVVGTGFKDTHLAFLWSDAIGMAASAVMGAHIGLVETQTWPVAVLCGLLTATFGGIARDVLCLEPPRALYAERSMYATPALLGSAFYVLLYRVSDSARMMRVHIAIPQWFVASAPFLLALFLRAAAWTYRLALPHWARKSASLFQPREKLSIELAPAKKAGDGN